MPDDYEVELGAYSVEERDGKQFLVYDCGCMVFQEANDIRILPCCPGHESALVAEVRGLLAELGLEPIQETRETLVKH